MLYTFKLLFKYNYESLSLEYGKTQNKHLC